MKLVWKLLRQHISVPQFAGFLLANFFGMMIVLLGFQFYRDVLPVFTSEDSFMKDDYLVVQKHIGTMGTFTGNSNAFSSSDQSDLKDQAFVKKIGPFISSQFKMSASMGVKGSESAGLNTEMFFESIPDDFIQVDKQDWHFKPGDTVVPIIMPRSYLNMYNFGFAQSHNLPKISEGLMGMISMDIFVHGNGREDHFTGKVIGFSSRLNSIVVPESFVTWANATYAPGQQGDPTRMIMQVKNPTDDHIAKYCQKHSLEIEDDKLDAEKTTWFLKIIVSMVMIVGLVISVLSFYILMLSIYLLVQKNTTKLENLLLIGYSPQRVAMPYQLLTIGLNGAVLLLVWIILFVVRAYYMNMLLLLYPALDTGSVWPSILVGILLFIVVSVLNVLAVKNKVMSVWQHKS